MLDLSVGGTQALTVHSSLFCETIRPGSSEQPAQSRGRAGKGLCLLAESIRKGLWSRSQLLRCCTSELPALGLSFSICPGRKVDLPASPSLSSSDGLQLPVQCSLPRPHWVSLHPAVLLRDKSLPGPCSKTASPDPQAPNFCAVLCVYSEHALDLQAVADPKDCSSSANSLGGDRRPWPLKETRKGEMFLMNFSCSP